MSIVDVNAIITGTPDKRILLGYQSMKESYNETSAEEFFNEYSKEPLSAILNNSEYIFGECFKGLDFYKDIVLNESSCIFTRINDEISKVEDYINEYTNVMDDTQKEKISSLLNDMKVFSEKYSDVITILSYVNEKEDNIEERLSNAIYEKDSEKVTSILEESVNDYTKYLYTPFVTGNEFFTERAAVNDMIFKTVQEASDFNHYLDTAVVMNRVAVSEGYKESLGNLGNMGVRLVLESWMNTEPIIDTINSKLHITQEEAGVVLHEDANDAVNSIFNDILEAALFDESNEAKKAKADNLLTTAYDKTMELFSFEASYADENSKVVGYSLIPSDLTFKEAYEELSKHATMAGDDFFESSDDDDVDDELDSLSNEVEKDDDKDDKEDSKSDTKKVDNKKEVKASTPSNLGKPEKPKAKNLATKIQTSAQDLEVKQMNAYSKMKQKGDEVKRAAKAVVALPMNVVNDIKKQVNDLNERDIERRQAYMTEPGFRKKAFRNLKLAILYGSAAQVKLSLVPILAVVRHFSKKKDKFVRKELIKDLATEIKVCDAKIEDAQNAGDNKEKYRLIRLRDQLERERYRVLLNSKKM